MGILVAATSPRLMLDDAYRDFLSLVASQIGTAIAGAQALEEAQARAEALAELDRAKTAFFSNVSHEFRTPLTLMLGPTEEALASPERALRGEDLETVHRNELRLLRLVNTLLDFSRIEAGRVDARFEPTDLGGAHRRSRERVPVGHRAGRPAADGRLSRRCQSAAHVDREMWEKIVLNLLSNAFKFTFQGSIAVTLAMSDSHAELRVRDTGIGIAPGDLDHMFDQVPPHRADGGAHARGFRDRLGPRPRARRASTAAPSSAVERARERARSSPCVIPVGTAHLAPADRAGRGRGEPVSAPLGLSGHDLRRGGAAMAALQTRLSRATHRQLSLQSTTASILVADDNADMRDYLSRVLAGRFQVESVGDGLGGAAGRAHVARPTSSSATS